MVLIYGGKNPQLSEKFPKAEKSRTLDIVASKLNIGVVVYICIHSHIYSCYVISTELNPYHSTRIY